MGSVSYVGISNDKVCVKEKGWAEGWLFCSRLIFFLFLFSYAVLPYSGDRFLFSLEEVCIILHQNCVLIQEVVAVTFK